jgi:hypothetical protein
MFAGKARAYSSEVPFKFSTLGEAPGLTRNHYTSLERLARDKRSSLLWKGKTYDRKKFYNIGHRLPKSMIFSYKLPGTYTINIFTAVINSVS